MCYTREAEERIKEYNQEFGDFMVHWMSCFKFDKGLAAEYLGLDVETLEDICNGRFHGSFADFITILTRCGYYPDIHYNPTR